MFSNSEIDLSAPLERSGDVSDVHSCVHLVIIIIITIVVGAAAPHRSKHKAGETRPRLLVHLSVFRADIDPKLSAAE